MSDLSPSPTAKPFTPPVHRALRALAIPLLLALLSACGGGGSGAPASGAASLAATPLSAQDATLSRRELLGKLIANDTRLSEPQGLACVGCHNTATGFASNNGSNTGTPVGSLPTSVGLRNAMTNAYQALVPLFSFRPDGDTLEAIGGHFWDGRANTMAEQAIGPFLNTAEMNNPDLETVMGKIAQGSYAQLFRDEFGAAIFQNPATAYQNVGQAIEAFERSAQLAPFTSKYDAMVRGQVKLSPTEARGMALFNDPLRANCSGCHLMDPTTGNPQDSPFSEFTYYATGIPRNRAIPQNADPSFYDLGLCGPNRSKPTLPAGAPAGTNIEQFCGKFRMPTLRNVSLRQTFMHNGFFRNLRDVVTFYSTRNSNPENFYGPAGVANDLPAAYLGNIESVKAPFDRKRNDGPLLSPTEIDDLLAFLRTLNDGFVATAN